MLIFFRCAKQERSLVAHTFPNLLPPQLVSNFRRKSVEGLSLATIVLWHLASALTTGYLIDSQEVLSLICAFSILTFNLVLVEAQFVMYSKAPQEQNTRDRTWSGVLASALGISAAIMVVCATWWACAVAYAWPRIFLGSILPSVLYAIGFFPQIFEIVSSRNADGISLGLITLDMCGCISGLVAVSLTSGDAGAAVVFVVNIFFHSVLIVLKVCIYATQRLKPDLNQDAAIPTEQEPEKAQPTSEVERAPSPPSEIIVKPADWSYNLPNPNRLRFSTTRQQLGCSPYSVGLFEF